MTNKRSRGAFSHKRFILALKATNALFDNDEHHDSHEFMAFLLDKVHEDFLKNQTELRNNTRAGANGAQAIHDGQEGQQSIIQELFMGKLVNVVTCVGCETTTRRTETFFNLSLDIEQNSSLIHCI